MSDDATNGRRVIAFVHVSMDGFTASADGGVEWLVEHAINDQMVSSFEGIWRGADTVLLGRNNYQGFHGFWPPVADDRAAPARDRDFASWLDAVEKVVFSRTLREATWRNARVAGGDLESEVGALRKAPGRDILVLNSATLIQSLLRHHLIDELRVNVLPAVLGGGLRLFPEGLPPSSWRLTGALTLATGGVGLHYVRT